MGKISDLNDDKVKASMPGEVTNILNDILGVAGCLYFLMYEEFQTKCDKLLPALGMTTDRFYDLKKDLINPIDRLSKTARRIHIRTSKESANDTNENDQWSLYLALKALCRLSSSELADEAIRLSKNQPNFNSRSHFMEFLRAVLDKSRKSNHDAIKMIQDLMDVLESDQANRVCYDREINDFRLSNIEHNPQ